MDNKKRKRIDILMDFSWAAFLGNHAVDALANNGARYLVSIENWLND